MSAAMTSNQSQCSAHARRWLRDLVAYPTLSCQHSNLELLQQVADALSPLGFSIRFTHSADRRRANLFASLGEGSEGGLLLSGHTDVVPVAGQEWVHPPFELTEEGDRFYGRGTCDMKGFLAAMLSVVERFGPGGLTTPLHLAFTYDEEIGCLGVRDLIADLARQGIRPAACIIGEPTSMRVVRAHKGRHAWRCRVLGKAAHSSVSGTGVNAAEVACELVSEIAAQARHLQSVTRDEGFYIPYSTMATCRVQSGHATNVIPEEAEFDFDLRYLPSQDPEDALAPILARAAALQADMRLRESRARVLLERRTAVPALMDDAKAEGLVRRLLGAGAELGAHVAYTTEGGLYQAHGIPTIICGPGDIAQAHTADEFILQPQLAACESVLERMLSLHTSHSAL